jgi:CRISPR/Cas system-associated exonuclease Cas4 (RecB family)
MEKIKLYKGKVEIEFDAEKHIYKIEGKRLISVTAITSQIDKSRYLIPWAIGLMKTFLIENWNVKKKIKEQEKLELIEEGAKQHQIIKKKAADIGTLVHKWAEEHIMGLEPELPKDEKQLNGVTAFLKWIGEHKVKFIESERVVYSRKHKFVGTMDAYGQVDGKLKVIDFKTGNAVYDEMRFQIAAYQLAYCEETDARVDGRTLIRFDKNTGEFHVHELPDYERDVAAFLAALTIKWRVKELAKYEDA